MTIQYRIGDLLESTASVLAHGVNCSGAFNAGVAKAIGLKYPLAKKDYINKFLTQGWKLGEVQFVQVTLNKYPLIANCASQQGYGRGRRHVDYYALETIFNTLFSYCVAESLSLAMPLIGSGLGGGDEIVIKKILEAVHSESDHNKVDLTVYSLN